MNIGIDIGINNLAFTFSQSDSLTHYHIDITNNHKYSRKKLLQMNILPSVILNILKILIFDKVDYKNTHIKIEKQLNTNTNCVIIQTIIQTLLFVNNYRYTLVSPNLKYYNIKKVIGKTPLKSDLVKLVHINKNNCFFYLYDLTTDSLVLSDTPSKYDDIVDSTLLTQI